MPPSQKEEENVLPNDIMLLEVINALKETVQIQNETIESLSKNSVTQTIENPTNKELEQKIHFLQKQNKELQERLANDTVHEELRKTKESYRSLFDFCFSNLSPHTPFDPAQARNFWENLVK
jgi:hypothetical protein